MKKNKTLFFLESNYSLLISLLHNNKPFISVCFFSSLRKTKNFFIFSFLLAIYRKLKDSKFKWFFNLFLKLFLYVYLSIFFLINKNIENIYTSIHTFTGSFLLNFLLRKKIIYKYNLIFPDDGLACHNDYFWEVDYSKKYLKYFNKFLVTKFPNIVNNDNRFEIFNIIEEFKKTNETKKEVFKNIFKVKNINKKIEYLLLTQPIWNDQFVDSLKEKNTVYENLLEDFNIPNDKIIFVKQHPREIKKIKLKKYKLYFLPKQTPIELFFLVNNITINNLITICSTSYVLAENFNKNINIYKKDFNWLNDIKKR